MPLSSDELLELSGVDTSTELTQLQRQLLRERAAVRTLQTALQNLYGAVIANRDIDSALQAVATLLPTPPPSGQWVVNIHYQPHRGHVQTTEVVVEASSAGEAVRLALADYQRAHPRHKQAWADSARLIGNF